MRLILGVFFWAVAALVSAGDDDWRYQSYKESERLPELHHAVDIELAEGMEPPASFKLKDGKTLQCATCHGLKDMDEIPYDKVNKQDPVFLRDGPYLRMTDFCYQCHDRDDHERPNIHVLLDQDGKLIEENCLYCHKKVHKNRDEPRERDQFKLRAPQETLCFGCHLKTPHLNSVEHLESEPDEDMRKHMDKSIEKHGIILPLSKEDKVMCVTCHTPHPEGIIDGVLNPAGKQVSGDVEEGIKYRPHRWSFIVDEDKKDRLDVLLMTRGFKYLLPYQRIENEVLLRLPAQYGELCLGCHQFDR